MSAEQGMGEEIPYDQIDVEIRRLVKLINGFPGIRTIASCAGHELDRETEIDFVGESQDAVLAFLSVLPTWRWRAVVRNDQLQWQSCWLTVSVSHGQLVYKLRVGGWPQYTQRQLLGEVEQTLASSV